MNKGGRRIMEIKKRGERSKCETNNFLLNFNGHFTSVGL
jgi:hypothetical protein